MVGAVRAGSVYEPADKKGLSSLTTALMNCGGSKTNKQQLTSDQDDLGLPPKAMINFESDLEEIKFQARCLGKDVLPQLTRVVACMREPKMQDADIEKAKDLAINNGSGEDTVSAKVERALLRSLIPANSPLLSG